MGSSCLSNQPIPTLEKVLDLYRHKRIGFLIEIKNPEFYPGIEDEVASVIKNTKNKNSIIYNHLTNRHQTIW